MSDTNDVHRDFQAWHGGIYAERQKEIAFAAWQAATERATPQWIPVTERMPEPQVRVIAFAERYKELCIDVWFGSNFEWGYTHWMPLPLPPAIRQGGA